MFRLFNNLNLTPFFAPPESTPTPTPTPSGGMGKEDIIEFLGGDDDAPEVIDIKDKKDEKDKGKKEGKKKEEEDDDSKDDDEKLESKDDNDDEDDEVEKELKDLEDELEEPDEDKLELTTPVRRREILKKYPKLFEDFPYLEKAYYREQQFTELLPTIKDAKEAVDKSKTLDNFENDLMAGNTERILMAVKQNAPKSFAKVADAYMSTLAKVDEKAYHHVLGNTIKNTIIAMVEEGNRSDNVALRNAAAIVNQFVFGSSKFEPPTTLSDGKEDKSEDNVRETELQKRERDFVRKKFNTSKDDLDSRVNNSLKATIEAHIDPKDSMSDYVKRNASREAIETVNDLIKKDTRFGVLVDKLWQKAMEEDFSKSSVDRIKSAFLSKAKTLLPTVIKKARNEALRGMGKRVVDKDDSDKTDKSEKTTRSEKSKNDQPRSRNSDGKSAVPKGMSTLEYLMSDD